MSHIAYQFGTEFIATTETSRRRFLPLRALRINILRTKGTVQSSLENIIDAIRARCTVNLAQYLTQGLGPSSYCIAFLSRGYKKETKN